VSNKKGKNPPFAKFKLGEKVRVRHGVRDTDYPDIPLGGWKGNVAEVHEDGMYTVEWNKETLASIHPVYKARCENDGLDFEQYGLGEGDLESDTGGPVGSKKPNGHSAEQIAIFLW
jgi:hypothetical protein